MVVGREIIREPSTGFVPTYSDKRFYHYFQAELILAFIGWDRGLSKCRTYLNSGEVHCTISHKNYRPDMTAVETDGETGEFKKLRIFEYYGHMFHECPVHMHNPDDVHPIRKNNGKPLTWGEIFELDQERLTVIKTEFGVTEVEVIYECEFYRDYIHHDGCHHNRWEEYIRTFPDRQAHLLDQKAKSESEILRMVNKYYPTTPFCTPILLVFFKDT